MTTEPKIRPRRVPRVNQDESKQTRKNVLDNPKQQPASTPIMFAVPMGANGLPMIEITVQSSETVPVAQFANVVVGPIAVRRWVEDTQNDDELREKINSNQELVESVVSEDRDIVQESVAAYNRQKEETEKGKK
jgi:hypothetical protein